MPLLSRLRSARVASARARRTDRQLVEILVDVPRLQQLKARHELLLLIGEHLGGTRAFAVPEDSEARTHLRAIVRAARRAEALGALREAVREIEPDDVAAAWFLLAVTVRTARTGPLPAGFMQDLIDELREHPQEFGQTAVARHLAGRRAVGRPLDGGSLPHVLYRLYDARVPAGDPDAPRAELLRFLGRLAAEPGRSDRLAVLLTALRAPVTAPGPVSTEQQVIIQIRVEEEDAPSDLPGSRRRYSLHGYYYLRTGDAPPVYQGRRDLPGRFTGEELAERGRHFLADWREPADTARGMSKRVEFLLPHALLGQPTESWHGGSAKRPLGRSCPVVVRSLTRYRDSMLHDEWIKRWQALDRDCPPGDALHRIGWMGTGAPDGGRDDPGPWDCPESTYPPLLLTDPGDVEEWLRSHADLSCLGLALPYDHDDDVVRDAVRDALLDDGIPVMVWRRDPGGPGPLLDALREGQPPGLLADLPHSVHQARRLGRPDPKSVHNQITLLWDDPTCVFSGQDGPMSGPRGAGEGAA